MLKFLRRWRTGEVWYLSECRVCDFLLILCTGIVIGGAIIVAFNVLVT